MSRPGAASPPPAEQGRAGSLDAGHTMDAAPTGSLGNPASRSHILDKVPTSRRKHQLLPPFVRPWETGMQEEIEEYEEGDFIYSYDKAGRMVARAFVGYLNIFSYKDSIKKLFSCMDCPPPSPLQERHLGRYYCPFCFEEYWHKCLTVFRVSFCEKEDDSESRF